MMIVSSPSPTDNPQMYRDLNTVASVLRRLEAENWRSLAESEHRQRRVEMFIWSILSVQILEGLILIALLVRHG